MRSWRLGRAVGLAAAAAAVLALLTAAVVPGALRPLKQAVNKVRGYPAWARRAAEGPEPPAFSGLAASQVGYGPAMVKQFSSPKPFQSFQVVGADGQVAFEGGPPIREVPTDLLGAIRTVWVGDFTPLRTSWPLPHRCGQRACQLPL